MERNRTAMVKAGARVGAVVGDGWRLSGREIISDGISWRSDGALGGFSFIAAFYRVWVWVWRKY